MADEFTHPAWSYSSNIYEVNVRQYTRQGTFEAFAAHLPRLKDMGVEILWFMPVTPISLKDRKGTLGSYYAVQNYVEANPEFGSVNDFTNLVETAHALGFKVIIDWVANHTGNDNVWIEQHPDFFNYDAENKIIHPNGWEDVSKLNYENESMQQSMIDAMQFWITTCNIDGFRCDMAHLVPLNFWKKAKQQLSIIDPALFWLAECEEPGYHEVFDATYTWKWMHKTEEFCNQQINFTALIAQLYEYEEDFPKDAFRVYFTSNHDENSWNGTEYEKYRDAAKLLAVFSCTWNGLPMLYSGQELPNMKRLQFFDKDFIDWNDETSLHQFYRTLLLLRKKNTALRAADKSVITQVFQTGNDSVFSFIRRNGENEIVVLLNFSPDTVSISSTNFPGSFINTFTNAIVQYNADDALYLGGWQFLVLEKTIFLF